MSESPKLHETLSPLVPFLHFDICQDLIVHVYKCVEYL